MGWQHVALATALLTSVLAGLLPASAQGVAPMRYGIDLGGVDGLAADGAKPQLASFWVGVWNRDNWGGVDGQIKSARDKGVTPIIQWYYWGDDISSSCVEKGCYSGLHSNPKNKDEWFALAQKLADSLRTHMGGKEALVIIETEFNKGDIVSTGYAPTFDGYLKRQIDIFHGVPGVKVILGFGSWYSEGWKRFPQATSAMDYSGFQVMRGSTRHTEAEYMTAGPTAVDTARLMKSYFGKPIIFTDLSLSSYPEPYWAGVQDKALKDVFARMPDLQAAGVQGLVYRSRVDVNMDLDNYFGQAERHWGFVRQDGSWKPSYRTWLDHTKGSTPPPPANAVPGTIEAEAFYAKSTGGSFADAAASGGKHWNLWTNGNVADWVQASATGDYALEVVARGSSAGGVWPKMTLTVDGVLRGSWDVSSTSYRTYAATVPLTAGKAAQVQIAFTNDAVVDGQDRNLLVDVLHVNALAPPAKAVPGSVEAEAFAAKSTGGAFADAAASGGKHWNLWTNGHLSDTLQSQKTGDHRFEIVARGSSAGGVWPKMILTVDGVLRGSWDVTSTSYLTYGATVPLTAGKASSVRIAFTNDAVVNGQDRNLLVDVLHVRTPNAPPTATFGWTLDGRTVHFDGSASSDPEGTSLTRAWSFGDGATGSGAKASRTYAAPGSYAVRLTVTDAGGATATTTKTVEVPNRAPTASWTHAADGLAVSADASASGDADGDALTYSWDWSDGATGTGAKATHAYAKAGTYRVTLTVSDGYDAVTLAKDVTVSAGATYFPPTLEAEAFREKTTGTAVDDAAASAGRAWLVWANGAIRHDVTVAESGTYRLTVTARGNMVADEWTRIELRLGTTLVGAAAVDSATWQDFTFPVTLSANDPRILEVRFVNDYYGGRDADRNLWVDKVSLRAATVAAVEAEACSTKSTGGAFNGASASGGKYWNLWANGYVECALTAADAGRYRVEVVAGGTPAANKNPHAVLSVNGRGVAEWDVAAGVWRTYGTTMDLAAGAHKVRVTFTNDHYAAKEDRNLHVDLVRLVPA